MTDIAFLSANRLAKLIRKRKIGCLELLDHYLSRVERFNPALNAIISTDIPAARRRARLADKMVARGEKLAPLHGVPVTVKNRLTSKDWRRAGAFQPTETILPKKMPYPCGAFATPARHFRQDQHPNVARRLPKL